jgi:steroid delta-isomerase-like uncharacterized protein
VGANKDILERYVELYNAGDLAACMELYAEEAVQAMHDGVFVGRQAIEERLARDLTTFPDITYTVISFVEQGDRFADEFVVAGTQTGPLSLPDGAEIPPTGRHVEIRGMEFVEVRDGKIVFDNLYYDSLAMLAQLGLVPQGAIA